VVAVIDPNPKVGGQGIKQLVKNGIAVCVSCLEDEAYALNADFMQRMAPKADTSCTT
jgi:diaminohydroxyphosphoribosylaminopyrimidine deaminase / 5-amino-6-(5-phosphoribosylamino)uracil reductase